MPPTVILICALIGASAGVVVYLEQLHDDLLAPSLVAAGVTLLTMLIFLAARRRMRRMTGNTGREMHIGLRGSAGRILSPADHTEVPPGYTYRVWLSAVRPGKAYVVAHRRNGRIYPEVVLPPITTEPQDGWAKVRAGAAGDEFELLLLEVDRDWADEVQGWIGRPQEHGLEMEHTVLDTRVLVLASAA